ncbi:uncharacterized protein LOC113272462 [Papaver somniferum]|uniref:uncharacterized protein LOC113272462 n=1 Tax=Papaver somniferum TaxID=3469 RepID=UPI000E6FB19D|nr:uncharacterized protein LOC113272462 [Papaver somniferum]
MHQILTKAWRPSGVFTITDIGSGTYNVKFSLMCDLIAVLQGTPWSVKEDLILIEIGNEESLLEDYDFKYVIFSLHIYGLPLSMLNAAKVFSIVSIFGTPEPIDPSMAAKWDKFAKVIVRLDISKLLPKDMEITLKSKKKIKISFRYEKVPRLCFHCGYFGHIVKQCPHLSKELEEDTSLSIDDIILRMNDRSYARYNEKICAFFKTIDDGMNRCIERVKKMNVNSQEPLMKEINLGGAQNDTRLLNLNLGALRMNGSNGEKEVRYRPNVSTLQRTSVIQGKDKFAGGSVTNGAAGRKKTEEVGEKNRTLAEYGAEFVGVYNGKKRDIIW